MTIQVDDQLRVYLDRAESYPLAAPVSERAMDVGAMVGPPVSLARAEMRATN